MRLTARQENVLKLLAGGQEVICLTGGTCTSGGKTVATTKLMAELEDAGCVVRHIDTSRRPPNGWRSPLSWSLTERGRMEIGASE